MTNPTRSAELSALVPADLLDSPNLYAILDQAGYLPESFGVEPPVPAPSFFRRVFDLPRGWFDMGDLPGSL